LIRRKFLLLWLLIAAVALLNFGPRMVAGPELRTQTYFAFQRRWIAHWSVERGRYLPLILLPAASPLAPVWYEMAPHVRMRLDPEDIGQRTILQTGQYEDASFNMVREHLSTGATFVDVGANFGIYSLRSAPLVGATGHVIAVEPNPESLERLRTNVGANHESMVEVVPVACSDREGTLDLYVAPKANTGETSLSRTNASQDGAISHIYKVRTRPLDDIIREAGVMRVDAIKIDVEGAEYVVLKGAQQTLDRFHPMLLVEVVERQLRAMGSSWKELKEFLQAHGYREGRRDDLNIEFIAATSQ